MTFDEVSLRRTHVSKTAITTLLPKAEKVTGQVQSPRSQPTCPAWGDRGCSPQTLCSQLSPMRGIGTRLSMQEEQAGSFPCLVQRYLFGSLHFHSTKKMPPQPRNFFSLFVFPSLGSHWPIVKLLSWNSSFWEESKSTKWLLTLESACCQRKRRLKAVLD